MPFQIRTLPSAEPSLLIEPRVTPNNLVSLQALRAGAAISVSLVHLNLISVMLQGGSNERATLYPLASGVDLFFVISGFIMVYSSGQLFGKSDSLYIFFMRRIARVVPIYWLTMSIDLFLERKPLSLTNLFGSYFFVPFMESDGSIVPLYGVGWTLNFEMFFYCVFSIMIMFRRSIAILGVSTVLFSMMVLENLLQTPPIPVIFWSDPIVFEFIFGMLLAVIYRRGIRLPLPICLVDEILRTSPVGDSSGLADMRVYRMRTGIIVDVNATDRARLEGIVVARNSPQKHVWRARIVLLTAEGLATNEIMWRTGKSKTCLWRWQERFMHEGVDGLLRDKTRPSRITPLPPAVAERI